MSFAIGIPTLNRKDLLEPSLEKYEKDFPNTTIYVIDNGNQNIKNTNNSKIYSVDKNLGVACSWNYLCEKIYEKNDYALLVNDDVYLGYGEDVVKNLIDKNYGLVQSYCKWSVVLISKKLYDKVGKFDEIFYPAYYEDSDYLYRMELIGEKLIADKSLNPKQYSESQTYEKNKLLLDAAKIANRDRYVKKWGVMPLLETFKTPYNDL